MFDEIAYLRLYPDVAKAIEEGNQQSAWYHYDNHGREEGRKANDFDADFYLRAYPTVGMEIAAGQAASPFDHFRKIGRWRGYLSSYDGHRLPNAGLSLSPYGGFWIDQTNSRDILQGKLEIGQITERQAEILRFWMQNGYVVLRSAVPDSLIDKVLPDFDRAYEGGFPELRFECHAVARDLIPWQPDINLHASKAVDIHHFSLAIRELMFSDEITEFLGLIFEAKTFATQTLGFLRGSAQAEHQNSAFVPFTIPRQFAASWVALEDVTLGAGELMYYPGSHHFEDFVYHDGCKSVYDASTANRRRHARADRAPC